MRRFGKRRFFGPGCALFHARSAAFFIGGLTDKVGGMGGKRHLTARESAVHFTGRDS